MAHKAIRATSVVWFRRDLRLQTNNAVSDAASRGDILPIYILDDSEQEESFKMGAASKIWLHHSLLALKKSLGGKLNFYIGKSDDIIDMLIQRYCIKNVFCNMSYEPYGIKQEEAVRNVCNRSNINYKAHNSNYMLHPEDVMKDDGSYYKVFTPYRNKFLKRYLETENREFIESLREITAVSDPYARSLEDLALLPQLQQKWWRDMLKFCLPGESEARNKLNAFMKHGLSGYKRGRDHPSDAHVSMLSSHLHFGEISPHQIMKSISAAVEDSIGEEDIISFQNEIIWREFSSYLLYHFANIYKDNFNKKFDALPWKDGVDDEVYFMAWKRGETGYPIIDAGMRELWQTGYMHNRVRMIVASFLVKNLNIHWHRGRDWFGDCLFDADLANNSASWQWVAGCGVDAAPYFRIFNPVTQGEKFDTNGDYTKKFVPELKSMPAKYIFKPWMAPARVLQEAGIVLGKTYPLPIVDLDKSRNDALDRYKALAKGG